MKTKRKWNNQRQKMRKRENVVEREDVLKALKRAINIEKEDNNIHEK